MLKRNQNIRISGNIISFISFFIMMFFCVLNLSGVTAEADNEEFYVRRIGQMICYRENAFSVQAPEDGIFSVRIYDDIYTYRVITQPVQKGINTVLWDGCGYNGERMDSKYYHFDFSLDGVSGKQYLFYFWSPIVENAQHLHFVLPSGKTAYLNDPEEWFIETKSVRDGILCVEFYRDEKTETPDYTYKRTLHMGRVEHYTLEKLSGQKKPDPGEYYVKVYENDRPDEITSFFLRIESGSPESDSVCVTGDIMPGHDASDDEIWQAMMRPSVVVDIDPQKHQDVYLYPDRKSESLGTLHGQTQAVAVLEILDEWARVGAWNHEEAEYIEGWIPLNRLKVVKPNTEYGLLVDKSSQTLSVFHNGKKIETLLVSTGRMDPGKLDRETSAGCFLTGLHRVDFSTQGLKYDFVIQYDGGNLLHQIPYSSDGKKDFTQGKAYLGSKASHACIRIQNEPGPLNGINAYWIWTHLPYRTKIIILDDPVERSAEKARLSGTNPIDKTILFNEPLDISENSIVMTFAGDMIPGSTEAAFGNKAGFNSFFNQTDPDEILDGLRDLFSNDDLTCLSLACILQEERLRESSSGSPKFRGLPEYAEIFADTSVELIALGDDHLFDNGMKGFDSTVKAIENTVQWVGTGHSRIIEIKNHRFGFAVCTQQEYLKDTGLIGKEIQLLKEAGCDYVIVQCHWGNEKDKTHGKLQEAIARTCIREGADFIIGRHPEAVQGIDEISGSLVFYSLGRLMSDLSVRTETYDTLAVQVVFNPDSSDRKPGIRLIPLLSTSSEDHTNNYCPVPAGAEERKRILNQVQQDTGCKVSVFQGD